MIIKKYDTVLFDLDGTLLNTLSDLTNGVNYALDHFGYPHRSEAEIRVFIGDGIYKLLERSMPDGSDEAAVNYAVKLFREHYNKHQTDFTVPYEGMTELLDCLVKLGINTAVVSNKRDENVKALAKHFFPCNIMFAAGNIDFSKRKPDPYLINKTIEHFKSDKRRVLYIGDTEIDINAAKNAKIDCLCVSYGFRDFDKLVKYGAKHIAKNANEILNYIIQEDA